MNVLLVIVMVIALLIEVAICFCTLASMLAISAQLKKIGVKLNEAAFGLKDYVTVHVDEIEQNISSSIDKL
jgi:hypothetical protein